MKRLWIMWLAFTPFLLGAYCSVNVQEQRVSEVQRRATAFAAGEYPDLVINEVLLIAPFITPTAFYPSNSRSATTVPPQIAWVNTTPTDASITVTPFTSSGDDNPTGRETPSSEGEIAPTRGNGNPPGSTPPPLSGGGTPPPPPQGTPPPGTPPSNHGGGTPPPPRTPQPDGNKTATPSSEQTTPVPKATTTPTPGQDQPTSTPRPVTPTSQVTTVAATPTPTEAATSSPDMADIAFTQSVYQANEGDTEAVITLIITGTVLPSTQVTFSTQDQTAVHGFDYQATTQVISFKNQTTLLTIAVPLIDNNTDDPDQQHVLLQLTQPQDINLIQSTAILEIADNDTPPSLQFSASQFTVMENQPSVLTVTLSRPSGKFILFGYQINSSAANSAIVNRDYQGFTTGSMSFGPDATGNTPTEVTFTWSDLIDDQQPESNKTLQFYLLNPPANAILGPISTTTLIIQDNDTP